jgi:hypothetical protein
MENNTENKKPELNVWIYVIFASIIALRLIQHISFNPLSLKHPWIDVLYIAALIGFVYKIVVTLKRPG